MPNLYLPNFALILTLREWELESRGVVAGGTTIAAATTTASLAGAVAYQKASHKAMPLLYPSIIFQERVLGFVMGSAVGVGAMLYDQRMIWRSTAQLFDKLAADRVAPSPPVQAPPPLLGKEVRDQLAHAWNSTVDNTLGALVVALSSRGW